MGGTGARHESGLSIRLEFHIVPRTARARSTHSPPPPRNQTSRDAVSPDVGVQTPERPAGRGAELRARRSLRVHLVGRVRQRGLAVVKRAPACTEEEKIVCV